MVWKRINDLIARLDKFPLWWLGFILFVVVFYPYLLLKQGSVFVVHDQLDETLMTYVLNARYLGQHVDSFPEILGGIPVSGMQPSAILFIPLYKIFPTFVAFLVQNAVVWFSAFFGMYFAVRELSESDLLSLVLASCFSMLPFLAVYGLSTMGVPLLLYCALCLWKKKRKVVAFLGILMFGLTTHLVLIGYVVLGFWLLGILWSVLAKRGNKWLYLGFWELLATYLVVNRSLFVELLIGTDRYVSHREELVNQALPFWDTVREVFLRSAQHVDSLHQRLILPILLLIILGACFFPRMERRARERYLAAAGGLVVLAGIALLYGICKSEPVVAWKNSQTGFLRYFQLERFYWLYPAGWYLEFVLCLLPWWNSTGQAAWNRPAWKVLALGVLLLPTMLLIRTESSFYRNIDQKNNGSGITGYITWESYYAEDLMDKIEETIGRDMDTYRVAHLGISPAPSLLHGFYTVDGYSNNYPLDYKHRFRKVIERELELNTETASYFDTWGSRCYLFNSQTGTYWSMPKGSGITYEGLLFDMQALKELGCEYLFSGGEILDPERMGLEYMGYFETKTSYWGIYLYRLAQP